MAIPPDVKITKCQTVSRTELTPTKHGMVKNIVRIAAMPKKAK